MMERFATIGARTDAPTREEMDNVVQALKELYEHADKTDENFDGIDKYIRWELDANNNDSLMTCLNSHRDGLVAHKKCLESLQKQIHELQDTVNVANGLGILGFLFGLLGIGGAVLSLMASANDTEAMYDRISELERRQNARIAELEKKLEGK